MKSIIIVLLLLFSLSVQAQDKGRWVKGKASVFGTDFGKMQTEAVKRARADALNQAGIVVSASSFRVQTEDNKNLNDYYSQFSEATSRGIITDERNIRISDPVRVSGTQAKGERMFQIDAELEAFVVIPAGIADAGFTVAVQTNKTTFREHEPVTLAITPSKEGYVTIFHVKNDTIQIPFPNALSRNNKVTAKKKFVFPTDYELYLTIDGADKTSVEEFIVVVTKEDIPAADIGDARIVGDELQLPKMTMTELSRWLSKIPLNIRTMGYVVLTVVR